MVKSSSQPLIEFNVDISRLSKQESQVLKLLVQAGKLIAPLYLEQEGYLSQDISLEEVAALGKRDSSALSPYTVIEKIDGDLKVTPYHVKYAKFLQPIADKLNEASRISDNKDFSRLLKLQAKALLDGNYEEAMAASIEMKSYILDIYIGPLNYFNRLFAGKAAYQAWVGILDVEGTKRLNDYKSVVFNESRKALVPNARVENFDHVKAKTIDEVLISGLMVRTKFVGLSLPMDINWIEKYGSEVTIFNQVNNSRLEEQIIPTFKRIFSKAFQEGFTTEDLRRASLRYVALHELAHNYLYYKNSARNLQDLFPIIFELTATLLGMRIGGSLLLIDKITNKQLESMIVAFVCRSWDLIEKSKKNNLMINYALGGVIFINFMIERGAIKQRGGMTITNFAKIFLSMQELSYIMERLLSQGSREETDAFIKKLVHYG